MSAARTDSTDAPDHFDDRAVRVARTLVDLFGIDDARRIAFQANSYLKTEFGGDQ